MRSTRIHRFVTGCLRALPALAVGLLSACSLTAVVPDQRVDRLIAQAEHEWTLWGQSRVALDDQGALCELASDGHCRPVDVGCGKELAARSCGMTNRYWWRVSSYRHPCDKTDQCRHQRPDGLRPLRTQAWSAAFISFLFESAGFADGEFKFSATHADYVSAARDGRLSGLRLLPMPQRPQPGDLLCAGRARAARLRVDQIDQITPAWARGRTTPMHCDLVVARAANAIETIGGNLLQSVSRRRIALTDDGLLHWTDAPGQRWLLVLRPGATRDAD